MTPTRHGYPLDEWEAAKAEAKTVLVERARERRTITYGELCDSLHPVRLSPRSFALLRMLQEVCSEIDAERGVMLASLVVRKADGVPGDGYFSFAARLGRDVSDRRAYWASEVARIYDAYAEEGSK